MTREQRYKAIFTSAYGYMTDAPGNKPDNDDELSREIFKACKADKQEMFFGMEPDIPRIKKIFKVCYELLDKYKNGVPQTAWEKHEIYYYWKGKLEETDMLGVRMFTACVVELGRQYNSEYTGK